MLALHQALRGLGQGGGPQAGRDWVSMPFGILGLAVRDASFRGFLVARLVWFGAVVAREVDPTSRAIRGWSWSRLTDGIPDALVDSKVGGHGSVALERVGCIGGTGVA